MSAPLMPADRWGERLPRKLGLVSAVAVLVGSTIGSGIFRTPAVVAARVPSEAAFAAGWIIGGILALAGALTFAELAALYPRTGGMYVYIREAFGRAPAFLFGWAELLIIRPASYGAIAVTSAEYGWRLVGVDGGGALSWFPALTRAQFIGTTIVVVLYLAANLVYAHVIPLAKMPGSPLIAADAANVVMGSAGVAFVSAAVMISTFGTLNGSMMTGPRVFFAMAEDR